MLGSMADYAEDATLGPQSLQAQPYDLWVRLPAFKPLAQNAAWAAYDDANVPNDGGLLYDWKITGARRPKTASQRGLYTTSPTNFIRL